MYAFAVIAAVVISKRRYSGDPQLVDEVALWGFPAGLIGGRLYHLATSWDEVPHTWWGPFAVWKGGLGIWGGIALGVAVGLWRVKRNGASLSDVHGRRRARAAGRPGDRAGRELVQPGAVRQADRPPVGPEDRPRAPPGAVRSTAPRSTPSSSTRSSGTWRWRRCSSGSESGSAHPGLFALYVAGYSAFRIFAELIRVDPAKHILGLRLNLFVAVTLCVIGLLWFWRTQRHSDAGGSFSGSPGSGASSGSSSAGGPSG